MEISKELFEKVMGIKLGNEHNTGQELMFMKTVVYYTDISKKYKLGDIIDDINIYELVHECKVWAKNKGYVVGTDLDKVNIWSIKERIIVNHFDVDFEDYLEFEIKACQWILENETYKEENIK